MPITTPTEPNPSTAGSPSSGPSGTRPQARGDLVDRVLDQIDHECRHPGCHATAFLQYDHVQPYEQDGPTVISNLQRLCGPHNRGRTPSAQAGARGRPR